MHAIYATPVISIHAPTRGATYNGAKYFIHCADFNPRSHEGSDRSTGRLSTVLCISIHAPTRGATDECRAWKEKHNAFQSTLPRGERPDKYAIDINDFVFQSTLPRGERLGRLTRCRKVTRFQSTLPRGERHTPKARQKMWMYISIHAPTRGAT